MRRCDSYSGVSLSRTTPSKSKMTAASDDIREIITRAVRSSLESRRRMCMFGLFGTLSANLAVILFLAVCESLLPARADARPLRLEDYYRFVTVQAPAMSPDGRWVAFIRTTIVEAENRRQAELWIIASDGNTPPRRLSDPAINAAGPRWSPDGTLLAFSGRRRGTSPTRGSADEGDAIWFIRPDRPDDPAVHIRGVGGAPIFSPDNRWIAFTRRVAKPKVPQYATDAERVVNERFIASRGRAYDWLNYRFDQRGYLPDPRDPQATPPEELFIVTREGGEPRQITRVGVNVSGVTWRADGGALAFVANEFERDEYVYRHPDLWTVTPAGPTTRPTHPRDRPSP